MRKSSSLYRTETPRDVETFYRVKKGYLGLGLCDYCAAQASYGHAHGFAVVEPPRPGCIEIVETFDFAAPNGWRKASRERLREGRRRASAPRPITCGTWG